MMASLTQRAISLTNSVRALGFVGAARAHADNFWDKRSGALPRLRKTLVKGVKRPLYYRGGTSDWPVLCQIFMHNEYQVPSHVHLEAVRSFYSTTLARGGRPIIVDCGANVGFASIWFANHFPEALIYAIEPEPQNFSVLRENCIGYDSIVALQVAISDRTTKVSLSNSSDESWAWETVEQEHGAVETITMAKLLESHDYKDLFIVKLDIEGFEVELFRSNLEWVNQTPIIVFESHDAKFPWRGTAHSILSTLTSFPRDYLQKGENTFAIAHSMSGPPRHLNMSRLPKT